MYKGKDSILQSIESGRGIPVPTTKKTDGQKMQTKSGTKTVRYDRKLGNTIPGAQKKEKNIRSQKAMQIQE